MSREFGRGLERDMTSRDRGVAYLNIRILCLETACSLASPLTFRTEPTVLIGLINAVITPPVA